MIFVTTTLYKISFEESEGNYINCDKAVQKENIHELI